MFTYFSDIILIFSLVKKPPSYPINRIKGISNEMYMQTGTLSRHMIFKAVRLN